MFLNKLQHELFLLKYLNQMEVDFRLDEIDMVAVKFLNYCFGNKIFTFSGDLGAGKTTFIEAVCRIMGVSEIVTSPTYSLIHEYKTSDKKIIYHMDFYRLNSPMEAIDAGIEECIFSDGFCMIEWPSKIENILPPQIVKSEIFILNGNMRKLVVKLP